MKKNKLIISTGFALFSMFFGSGNLVFPITVGQQSEGHYTLAALGILMTGVLVPFLGVFGMLLHEGNLKSFFKCFGKKGTFWFALGALALMGPFGVLARCLTVAHGALQLVIPQASLVVISISMCFVIYLLTINRNQIVNILGTLLTPFLLIAITMITCCGLGQGTFNAAVDLNSFAAFKNGFFQGYQTMDLLAAFFFSTFIIQQLSTTEKTDTFKIFGKAALIGATLLSAVYIALVLLGWMYAPLLQDALPQEMLGHIAVAALGPLAAPCVCIAVVLACLTTAIVLASLFADFLRQEVTKNQISHQQSLAITLAISFLVSTLDFAGIAAFLGPILEFVYPALIVLSLVNIAHYYWGFKASHWPVTLTLIAKMCSI
jgi:LIVCS family branched-chain amino acid:cation transporter